MGVGNRKEQFTVTCLDITIEQLKQIRTIELYRRAHCDNPHRFSESGRTQTWIPSQKLQADLSDQKTNKFYSAHININTSMRCGFDNKKATVSRHKTIIYSKQKYSVVVGSEKLAHRKVHRFR
jgi:hypothetical protein